MNDLELAVRTIESIIPDMPTKGLQKWKGILTTALVKIEAELETVSEHTCTICLFQEFGYRMELPIGWRQIGEVTACFQHEDSEIKASKPAPEPVDQDKALEDLMALV